MRGHHPSPVPRRGEVASRDCGSKRRVGVGGQRMRKLPRDRHGLLALVLHIGCSKAWIRPSSAPAARGRTYEARSGKRGLFCDETEFGIRYVIDGWVLSPAAVHAEIRTVWFVDQGKENPLNRRDRYPRVMVLLRGVLLFTGNHFRFVSSGPSATWLFATQTVFTCLPT